MIEIKDKKKCCGCTACYNACPVNAISMEPDFEGFLYPSVDKEKCIDCGLCERVCPIINFSEPDNGYLKSFVLRTKDKDDLLGSTSGGFTTPLIDYVISHDGIVCCASYNANFKVEHIIVSSQKDVAENKKYMRGSKYVQSDLGESYKAIKTCLQDNKLVCFIGTTCQVTGLKQYLGKEYENLITVDLVCHGTPSPLLFEKYVKYQEDKHKSKIEDIVFRNKTYGYHSGTMRIKFANGDDYFGSARVDYMLKSFFTEIASRPSCYECRFKTKKRVSDFTIYDAWRADQIVKSIKDDDKGYTNVIVHSQKGLDILETLKDEYCIYEADSDLAVKLDGKMVMRSAVPHPLRDNYYKDLATDDLGEHINKFIPITRMDYFFESFKIVLYKMGLIRTLKKIKKRIKK